MFYYRGYKITKDYNNLVEEELHVLYACRWLILNHATIRETALNCKYSATTFWRRIHNECRQLSPELYKYVVIQMQKNLEREVKR